MNFFMNLGFSTSSELYKALAVLGCIFALGVIATFIYTRMMVYIGQGVLKSVRDDMFEHMQTLPIRYFDQNTNGSVMSLYTNDTDTLRQMISQAIPQALMALFTIVVTFISMLLLLAIFKCCSCLRQFRLLTGIVRPESFAISSLGNVT